MPSGNRVEELESRVKELEATVAGLTDELIECKVRVREVENALDAETGFDTTPAEDLSAEEDKTEAYEEADETEADRTEIIVA